MDLESQNEWISVSLYDRCGPFVGGGEGDDERERKDERGDDDGDDECGDDDGDDDDECDEAYGVTFLESTNGDDDDECDEAYSVTFLESTNGEDDNVNGDGGENPPEYEDVDNGDGVGDGNGVFWDECVGEDEAWDEADEAECDGEGVVDSPDRMVLLLEDGLGVGGSGRRGRGG